MTRNLAVQILEHAPNGRVTLRVAGGASAGALLAPLQAAIANSAGGQLPAGAPAPAAAATSLEQMVQRYREKESNDQIVARLTLPTFTANVNGQEMRTLPPALLDVMRSPRNSALRLQNDEVKATQTTPWVVSGMVAVTLSIERRSWRSRVAARRPPRQRQCPDPHRPHGSAGPRRQPGRER